MLTKEGRLLAYQYLAQAVKDLREGDNEAAEDGVLNALDALTGYCAPRLRCECFEAFEEPKP